MIRNVILVVAVMFLIAWGGFAICNNPIPPGDYTYAVSSAVKTLDPARVEWTEDIRLTLAMWEGLLAYAPVTAEPIPGVAEKWETSADGLTWTFTFRENAKWSNGDPVTPEDFIYGWRRAIEPGTYHTYATLVTDNIAGAKEYNQWRNDAVSVLLTFRELESDRKAVIDEQEMKTFRRVIGDIDVATADLDKLSDEFLQNHLSEMDARFAKVGVKALDARHLEVKLDHRVPFFLDLMPFTTFLPIHKASLDILRVEQCPGKPWAKKSKDITDLGLWTYDSQWIKPDYTEHGYPGLVTNGPFCLKQWQLKRHLYFERNENYWDKENVKTEKFVARIIPDLVTAFLAYEKGEVAFHRTIGSLDFAPSLVKESKAGKRDDIHRGVAFGTYYYIYNCQKRIDNPQNENEQIDNPFYDKRVRMAFNLAVNKKDIVEKVLQLGHPVANNFIPPDLIPGYSCPAGPGYNPDKARQLLAEAGYPDGEGFPPVNILFNTMPGHLKIAQVVARMWKNELGVTVELDNLDTPQFSDKKTQHKFMVCRAGWFGDYYDPTTFLDMMKTGNGQNDPQYSNPEYDKLLAQAEAQLDQKKRMAILAQAETMMLEDAPVLTLYNYIVLMSYRDNVKGITPNPREMSPFKDIYIEKD
ncbi:MAG: peptide ABC transporter substrate-binding protein [Phycisphaerae bacterium]|nr:peptide ABC transporter substrate-binding protein [Phycisphaerae bacterium]